MINLVPRTFTLAWGRGGKRPWDRLVGVLNYHMLNGTFKMAVSSSKPKFLSVLRRVEFSLNNGIFHR